MRTPSGSIRTYTGKIFPVFEPQAHLITLLDIAHALSLECRWQGMCKRMFSVAEHSIWVAKLGHPDDIVYGLIHDAHEAYLSDIPKPLKDAFPALKEAASRIDTLVYQKLGIQAPSEETIHRVHMADEYSAWIESRVLFEDQQDWQPGRKPPDDCEAAREMYYSLQEPPKQSYMIRDQWLSLLQSNL